jgi:hypothetical protein
MIALRTLARWSVAPVLGALLGLAAGHLSAPEPGSLPPAVTMRITDAPAPVLGDFEEPRPPALPSRLADARE